MERLYESGLARRLGVSNVSLEQLESLVAKVRIKPTFVQNRCYAIQRWGRDIRDCCHRNAIKYQAFSLLTANARYLTHAVIVKVAERHQRSPIQIVFRFAIDCGMIPLTGTSQAEHMQMDLAAFDFQLSADEVSAIENIAS
jgi:diketogulonate reductase-like aldo/keto reductase